MKFQFGATDEILKELFLLKNNVELAEQFKCHIDTIKRKRKELDVKNPHNSALYESEEDLKKDLTELTDEQITEKYNASLRTIGDWRRKFKIAPPEELHLKHAWAPDDKEWQIDSKRYQAKKIRFGIVADSHLCSYYQQLTHLHTIYKYFAEEGIRDVFHPGDLFEGDGSLYRGQRFEINILGSDRQVDYGVKNYPYQKEITTHVVDGSHDYTYYRNAGARMLERLSEKRKDIKYLGSFGAYVILGGIKIYLMHGDGGIPYASSYRMQKIIENFPPEKKPDVLLLGHYHRWCFLPMYRNVVGLQMGCFQSQTTYLRAKGLYPEIGGAILELDLNDTDRENGIVRVTPHILPFFVPCESDY